MPCQGGCESAQLSLPGRYNTSLDHSFQHNRPLNEVDLQTVLSQEMCSDKDIPAWNKRGFYNNVPSIEGNIHKVVILLDTLPSRQKRMDSANEPCIHQRS